MSLIREVSAGYMTNLAARLFARAIDDRLRCLGVSSGHLPVFFALADGGGLTQTALAQAAAIEQPTMAATLSRMERAGLILRRPDPRDGRSALIFLTPAALEKARVVEEAVKSINEGLPNWMKQRKSPFSMRRKSSVGICRGPRRVATRRRGLRDIQAGASVRK